jgi:hypothetical protein
MNHLDAVLAARAHSAGRALRRSLYRHRRLVAEPLAVVLWQLGAEPFSAAALAWGSRPGRLTLSVAGEPRNRDLAFAALLPFARCFNARFEAPVDGAPQVVVANGASAEMLGRLGRRLAYLPTDGPHPADPALVRLGRHLQFLDRHRARSGQQLLVALTDLLNDHWTTGLSQPEAQSLAALDAWIEPPPGEHGFDAAARAELVPCGPLPAGEDDERLEPLMKAFNDARGRSTVPAVVRPLLGSIEAHYRPLCERAWRLLWRCRDRELRVREARSVRRRWEEDCAAYAFHMQWLARNGLRRTRQTPRQAAWTLRTLEEAGRLLEAEEVCDDPLRQVPALLDNRAVRGRVLRVDAGHREMATSRMVKRPLVTLLSPEPCRMPVGKELWWTEQPTGQPFVVQSVRPVPGGTEVALKLLTSAASTLPAVGGEGVFSVYTTEGRWFGKLPEEDPWTHAPAAASGVAGPIDEEETTR